MRILAISGSLRSSSSSTSIVHAATLVAPEGVTITVYDGLDKLPHFNPDLDNEGDVPPPAVAELRRLVGESDALLISTPEYAHGIPGTLKNALDWLVSSLEFPGIAVSVINPSAHSFHGNESLTEVIRTMSAKFPDGASARIALPDRSMTAEQVAANADLSRALMVIIASLAAHGTRDRAAFDL
jgi:NAD(P)H-dependent FMN reductase